MPVGNNGYVLVRHRLDEATSVLVLCEDGRQSFLDTLQGDIRRRNEASALRSKAIRLVNAPMQARIETGLIKRLHGVTGDVALFELRVKANVYRIMTYIHKDSKRTPVLLFDFRAHRVRASGGIPKKEIEKGVRLARIARDLMDKEDFQ